MRRLSFLLLIAIALAACSGGSPSPRGDSSPESPGTIAFMRGDHARDVYLMNSDGSNVRNVTNSPEFEDTFPSISPDGGRIAFVGDYTGDYDIFVINTDGSGRENLTEDAANESSPNWSPDGTLIAYSADGDIFVIGSDGAGRRRLTHGSGFDDFPTWSADGTKVLFGSDLGGGGVYEVAVDGGQPRRLLEGFGLFSPDGSQVALAQGTGSPPFRIVIADADGTNAKALFSGPPHNWLAVWSPDSSMLAVTNDRDGDLEIYTVNADGSGITKLTDNDLSDFATSWR